MSEAMPETTEEGPNPAPAAHEEAVAPLGLRIVAFLFILVGILSATEIVLSLIKGGCININLGVLGIFIGRGLLRRSERWRSCGTTLVVLLLLGAGLVLLACGAATLSASPSPGNRGISLLSVLAVVAVIGIAWWAFVALTGDPAREWCAECYTPDPKPRRFQFTIRTMLLVMVVCSFVFAKIGAEIGTNSDLFYGSRCERHVSARTQHGETVLVSYAYTPHRFFDSMTRLDYLVFCQNSKGPPTISFHPTSDGTTWGANANGVAFWLFNKPQLHEVVGGKHTTSDRRVTMEELKAYLDSKAARYSLQDFLDFVDRRRGKAK